MKLAAVYVALAALLLLLLALGCFTGPGLKAAEVLAQADPVAARIVFDLRLPRGLLAAACGAALAVAGVLMQGIFRNNLAEPYVTGVSAGGALGAVSASALGLGGLGVGVASLGGSLAITLALLALALRRATSAATLLLTGMALGAFCGAGVWFMLLHQGPGGSDQAISWLLGRTATVGWVEPSVLSIAALAGVGLSLLLSRQLDCLLLGEEKAGSLGVNVLSLQRAALGISSLLAGICVALCGVIAFAGLIVPHLARSVGGSLHGRLVPLSALGGSVFLVAVDLVARLADQPHELPITVVTSLIGAPFFIAVLLRHREAF